MLRSLGSVGAVAAAPGQGWCWTGPANTACPGPPAPLVPAVTCRAVEGPPAPAFRASLLRAERRERPRSQHEHPQGLQHLGHRLPGGERGVGQGWAPRGSLCWVVVASPRRVCLLQLPTVHHPLRGSRTLGFWLSVLCVFPPKKGLSPLAGCRVGCGP